MKMFVVDEKTAGQRADVALTSVLPQYSRSALEGLFDNQKVKVNGRLAKAGHRLKSADKLEVDTTLLDTEPEPIRLPMIYEDNDVVVINKPAGALTHSKGALNLEPTVASFLKTKLTDKLLSGNRAGIVHRLDRGTSGLIIGAKHSAAQRYLQRQFASRRVKKTYLAIVEGWPKPESAIIDAPIGRHPKKPQTFKVMAGGKVAQTEYHLLKKFTRQGKRYALLALQPLTGRTHQLRVHLSYIGYPIVGDKIYGHQDGNLLLHAEKLELRMPDGQLKVFKATLPPEMKDFQPK